MEAIEQVTEFRWRHPLRHGRRPANIGEQEAGLDLGAAPVLLEDPEARSAVERVLRPAVPVQEMHQGSADAAEWCRAHLATRCARDVLLPPSSASKAIVGSKQHRPPHPLVRWE